MRGVLIRSSHPWNISQMENRFKCSREDCGRWFCSKSNLTRHIRLVHHRVRKHECPVCMKRLSTMQTMRDHLNTHTGEKPYVCEYEGCTAQFRQVSLYSTHRTLHRMAGDPFRTTHRAEVQGADPSIPFLELPPIDWRKHNF